VALIEYWIQLENHAWDTAPNNIDRMSGENIEQLLGQPPVVTAAKFIGNAPT
jgi:hypothetical protein